MVGRGRVWFEAMKGVPQVAERYPATGDGVGGHRPCGNAGS